MNLCCRSTVHCLGCCAVPCCPVLPLLSAAPKRVVSVGITLKQSKENRLTLTSWLQAKCQVLLCQQQSLSLNPL